MQQLHNPMKIESSSQFVNNIGPHDILCGRCKTAFNHIGNRKFRALITLNVPKYLNTKVRHEKSALIVSIVRMIREDMGGRFLKKKGRFFVELDEKQAREKVGHALRDLAVQQQQSAVVDRTAKIPPVVKKETPVVRKLPISQAVPSISESLFSLDDVISTPKIQNDVNPLNFADELPLMLEPLPLKCNNLCDVEDLSDKLLREMNNLIDMYPEMDDISMEPLPLVFSTASV